MTQKLACYTKPEGDDLGIIVHDDLYVLHDSKGVSSIFFLSSKMAGQKSSYVCNRVHAVLTQYINFHAVTHHWNCLEEGGL